MTQATSNNNAQGQRAVGRLDASITALLSATSQDELFQNLCDLGRESSDAVGVALLSRQQGNVGMVATSPPMDTQSKDKPEWLLQLARPFGQMLAGNVQTIRLDNNAQPAFGIYVPLSSQAQGSLYLTAYVFGGRPIRLQSVVDALQLVKTSILLLDKLQTKNQGAEVALQDGSQGESQNADNISLLSVIDTMSEVQKTTRFFEAATTLCATVASTFQCRRVALGLARKHSVKLLALDQMENFARGTRTVRMLEEAMQESNDQRSTIFYSHVEDETLALPEFNEDHNSTLVTRATAELATLANVRYILTIPLSHGDENIFVLLLQIDKKDVSPQFLSAIHLVGKLMTPSLHQLRLAEEMPLKKLWRYMRLRSEDIFGPRHTMLKLAGSILGILLGLSLFIEGKLTVSASMVIEGVHSYTHTAPMDSYLSQVFVRPGDEVKVGDVLGRLDATEINLEIAALEAQQNIHESQVSQFLQEGKDAEAAIARHEAERTKANLRWEQQRLAMTELKSNVEGFLISEDMLPRLGQPVQRGQALFEITDTASLRLVAHVTEEDISDITIAIAENKKIDSNKTVQGIFNLTAYPGVEIPFTVERVHPYATVIDERNGFEVRGRTTSIPPGIVLRPGMEGYAKMDVGKRPWLILLLRNLVNKIRLLWWRWI